jgi:hypothetical protein
MFQLLLTIIYILGKGNRMIVLYDASFEAQAEVSLVHGTYWSFVIEVKRLLPRDDIVNSLV